MNKYTATPFFDPGTEALRFLPEGPRVLQNYPPDRHTVGWVAIQHGADLHEGSLNLLDLTTHTNRSFPLPGRPGFFAETTVPGVVLIGLERRLVYLNLLDGELEETGITVPGADERVIINDGLAVEGGVIFGTKHLAFNLPIAGLYFYDARSRTIHTLRDDQMCSNGKFLRREAHGGATLIDIDSIPKTISRYSLDPSLKKILTRAHVVDPASLPAVPDGLRPTPDGESIIVAYYNPEPVANGLAHQIRLAGGAVECEWHFPGSPRVTCPEFVELDGHVKLLFTTATEGMPEGHRNLAPAAGTLFLAETPFHQIPAPPPLVAK